MDLQRPAGVAAPVAQQDLDGHQALVRGVDVDVKAFGNDGGLVLGVDVCQQRGGEVRPTIDVVRRDSADGGVEEGNLGGRSCGFRIAQTCRHAVTLDA